MRAQRSVRKVHDEWDEEEVWEAPAPKRALKSRAASRVSAGTTLTVTNLHPNVTEDDIKARRARRSVR